MQVRRAVLSDLRELTRLRIAAVAEANANRSIPEAFLQATADHLANLLGHSDEFLCWVAEEGNTLVSTASVVPFNRLPSLKNPTGREGYVSNVYTEPSHRRRGHATAIMRLLVQDAALHGMRRLWLYSTPGGLGLYERVGFVANVRSEVEMHLSVAVP